MILFSSILLILLPFFHFYNLYFITFSQVGNLSNLLTRVEVRGQNEFARERIIKIGNNRKQIQHLYIKYIILNNKRQMKGRLFHEHNSTSPRDIALSSWEYQDLVDSVNDARLSPNALMRFKNLYRQHSMFLIGVPIITFPMAFFINKWIVGFASRGMASSRFNLVGMFLVYPITLYWGYTRPIPRKYYTELLADDGDDGDYIRDCVSHHKPELWRRISWQLESLNLDFKQNLHSNTSLEFPTNFVQSRSFL